MLKNFGYDGAYYDENISVSVLLENPLEHDLEAATLVFSVTVKAKSPDMPVPRQSNALYHSRNK